MKNSRFLILDVFRNRISILYSLLLILVGFFHSSSIHASEPFPDIKKSQSFWPLLENHCIKCHNLDDWKGKLEFETLSLEYVPEEAEIWEKVIRKLRGGLMPPPGEAQAKSKDTDEFIHWLEAFIDHGSNNTAISLPEPIHTRRLNRKEYAIAIRDLLHLEIDAATLLPQDTAIDGFDNMAEALHISPSYLDQSISAARQIASQAIGNPKARSFSTQYQVKENGTQQDHLEGLPLGTRGGMKVEHYFPVAGKYELNIADLARAMWVENQEFSHKLVALIDGKQFFELDIGGGEDLLAIDKTGGSAVDAINARLKNIPFHTEAGKHSVTVTFLHRSFAESEGVLEPIRKGGQDKIIRLSRIDIRGPIVSAPAFALNESRATIFSCYPQQQSQELACAEEIIHKLSRKAYRGFRTEADHQQLLLAYHHGEKLDGFESGIRHALTAMLANPKFLYHLEPEVAQNTKSVGVEDVVLANRMALFLWGSIPDEELLALAERVQLSEEKILSQQISRMLANPKAKNLSENFASQWLNLDGLDEIDPDPRIFAEVPTNIRSLFKEEIVLFVQSIFSANENIQTLLTARHTYLNETLATHYGVNTLKGDRFRQYEFPDQNRWGLLGKGGVLMVSAYPNRTSPVLRGAYILDHLTGTPPSPPPPNVEAFPENVEGKQVLSVRARLESHREDSSCNACHGIIDPLGFALENFDALGRLRDIDRFARTEIDASGQLPNGRKINNASELRAALLDRPDQFVQTFTEKLFSYALSRPLDYRDMPRVRAIVAEAGKEDYRLSAIVRGIINSPQFKN